VRLYSRSGNDFTRRFPLIVETLARLRSRSCIIYGEAEPFVDVSAATELLFYLERPASALKR
jgi:ATP-dependent DNA ligase